MIRLLQSLGWEKGKAANPDPCRGLILRAHRHVEEAAQLRADHERMEDVPDRQGRPGREMAGTRVRGVSKTVDIALTRYVPPEDRKTFFARADQNMYDAKAEGKPPIFNQ
jgi:PleD family two-component response regulator